MVQVCVLVSLLRRLAEIQHLGGEQADQYASPALSRDRSFSDPIEPASLRLPDADFVAVASALGAGPDEVVIFVTTFQRAVPTRAHLLLLTDVEALEEKLKETGIDLQRLTFHRVDAAEPWSALPTNDVRLYHVYTVLHGIQAKVIQVSEVEGIAFQANPFVWASAQPPGVHLFADNTLVGEAKTWPALAMCFGTEADHLQSKPTVASNYMIGTKPDVQRYLSAVVDKIKAAACNKRGVATAAANFVAQTEGTKVFIHNGQNGPVWTGENVAAKDIILDSEDHVINQDGYQYAVLRRYDQHQELWKSLQLQFGRRRIPPDCSSFEVEDGDMQGHDLTHGSAENEVECCTTCQQDPGCSAFIFSPSRKHCWLKSAGGIRTYRPGSDMRCGLRINGQA